MSTANSSDSASGSFITSEISLPRPVRFWLMLLFDVPSIICSLWLISYIIIDRRQRYALHNHTILAILIVGLPIQLWDITLYLIFFYHGSVLPAKPIVCILWWLADYGFYSGGIILMAWLAIERHILIFHDRWVLNRRGRFLFHYLPLISLLTYIVLFYIYVLFLLPCENTYDYTVPVCNASPCYQSSNIFGIWESIVNTSVPIVLEGIASVALILRVQRQKRRLRQSNQWRKQRRMTIQLFLISSLNVTLNLPILIIPLAHRCGLPPNYGVQAELYFFFLGYFVVFLFPFASLCQFPDLRKQMKKILLHLVPRGLHRTATVAPVMAFIPMTRRLA